MSATDQNSAAHAKMPDAKMPDPQTSSAKIPSAEMPNPARPSTHAQYSGVSKEETSKPKMPPPKLPSKQTPSLPEQAPKMPSSKRMTLPGTSAHARNVMPEGKKTDSKAVTLPCMPEGRVKDGKTSSPQTSETKAEAKTKAMVLPTDVSVKPPAGSSKRIEQILISELKPWSRNARTHSRKQIRQIADSIAEFGFTNPVLIDQDMSILAGHGRVEAAKVLGWKQVPCLRLDDMTAAQKRAYVLADNKLALNAGWDEDILSEELLSLSEIDLGFDLSITGFSIAEVDDLIDINVPEEDQNPRDEQIPEAAPSRVKSGDVWALGPHRLICGNSLDAQTIDRLMMRHDQVQPDLDLPTEPQAAGDLLTLEEEASGLGLDVNADAATADTREFEKAQMVFTDPPYNVPIDGHVGGNGKTVHREFAMASGEMTSEAFTDFLKTTFENLSRHAEDGSIHFICMDWRHVKEVMAAGDQVYNELKNLIVWSKDRGGMGTFYRSRHELIFAYKYGTAAHINSFELGQHGRYRTNVWEYPAASRDDLSMHPTVKPVQMICDAIRDVSSRCGIVLDLFGGSGSTLIAAHKTGRRARVCEIDPLYCDVILARYEAHAKDEAILLKRGGDFTNQDKNELEAA